MKITTGRYMPTNEHEAALLELVNGLEYRDGWELTMERDGYATILRLIWTVDDVHNPGHPTRLVATFSIDVNAMREQAIRFFLDQLWRRIEDLEGHERLELLAHNGKPIWPPHPPRSEGRWPPDPQLVCRPDGPPSFMREHAA